MNGDLNGKRSAAGELNSDDGFAAMEAGVLVALAQSSIGDDREGLAGLILLRMDDDDFTRADRRVIFQAMKALSIGRDKVDAAAVADWARANGVVLHDDEMAAVFDAGPGPSLSVVKRYIRRLGTRARFQAARRAVVDLSRALDEPGADIDVVVAGVQTIAFGMTRDRQLGSDQLTEDKLLPAFIAQLETRNIEIGLRSLVTDFWQLDRAIGGLGQALVIIGGPPSCGKTTFLKQLADQVATKNEVPVLYFTYEQSASDLRIKTLARLSGVNSRTVARGARSDLSSQQEGWDKFRDRDRWEDDNRRFAEAIVQYQTIGKHIRIVEAGRETTVDRIRLQAQAAKANAGAGRVLVAIDYIQLIPAVEPMTKRAFPSALQRSNFVCSELRRLARDLDSPVVAISSLGRGGYDAQKMGAFRESGGIDYGADVAILLKTTGEHDVSTYASTNPSGRRDIELRIVKNRSGEVGAIQMDFLTAFSRFREKTGGFTAGAYAKELNGGCSS
jgi:replicative DNA helicase